MNITKTTMTLAALAAGMAMHTAASEQGLVAHFTFDDAAHWGFDSVRQAEIGTIYNTVFWGATETPPSSCPAPIVRGLQITSVWWADNRMVVPGETGASFGSEQGIPYGNQPVTYSLWVKPSSGWQSSSSLGLGEKCRLLHRGPSGSDWYEGFNNETICIVKNGSVPQLVFGVGKTPAASSAYADTSAVYDLSAPFDGGWHFIAATYTNRMLVLYYDGQKVAEKELSANVAVPDNAPLTFGSQTDNYDWYCRDRYCGSVDDIKVYNRALDASEILAAYNAGATAHDSNVLVWRGAAAGGAVENLGNWGAASNRRTAGDIYAAGFVMDVTDVNDGATVAHNASATLALKGAICTNGQDEVTLRMQLGALAMKRPSTQRGLVAHLSFDDADDLTYDSGTAGLTATTNILANGSVPVPIRTTDGVSGKAMYFPENGSWNYKASPYLKTDSATTTKANGIPCGGETVSYSLWIKPLAAGRWDNGMYGLAANNYKWILRRGAWGNGGATYLWLAKGSNDGKLWWSIANYCDGDGTCSYEPSNLFDGSWHHVVCVYDNKTLTLYYDGVQVATTTASYSLNVSDGAAISLGNSSSEGNSNDHERRYLGGFDEFKVFNVALTAQEVAAEYAQGSRTLDTASPGTVPSPVRIQLDAGISAEVRGYGNEYGTLAGAGSVAVKPGSVLTLDGTFALAGELTGGGEVVVANLAFGGDTDAFTGDFTIRENARIEASAGNVGATFGGKVVLPANAVVAWGDVPQGDVITIAAASFELPADFSGWKDENGKDLTCKVASGVLRIRKKIGTILTIQ